MACDKNNKHCLGFENFTQEKLLEPNTRKKLMQVSIQTQKTNKELRWSEKKPNHLFRDGLISVLVIIGQKSVWDIKLMTRLGVEIKEQKIDSIAWQIFGNSVLENEI